MDEFTPWLVAMKEYQGGADELSFNQGDTIKVLRHCSREGWWKGELNGQIGMFPNAFVKPLTDGAESLEGGGEGFAGPLTIPCCPDLVVASFDYDGTEASELSFSVGDKIQVVQEDESGWFMGSLNGKEGLFPQCFTESIQPVTASEIPLPTNAKLFLACGQTRVQGALNKDGTKVKFEVDFIPRGTYLMCCDSKVSRQINFRSGLNVYFAPSISAHSSESVPWLPLDVLCFIFRMLPSGSRAALSLVCREFRRAAATLIPDEKTLTWTTRDEVDTLDGAFRLLREAPWFIGPQIVDQAEALLERVKCNQITTFCALECVRSRDLNLLTECERKVFLEFRQIAKSRTRAGIVLVDFPPDESMKHAWAFIKQEARLNAREQYGEYE